MRQHYSYNGADSIWHGGTCPPPTFTNGWARGGTVSRKTANKKQTKLYWPSRKGSPKRLIVLYSQKSRGARSKIFFPALCTGSMPPPTFKFVQVPQYSYKQSAKHHSLILTVYSVSHIAFLHYCTFKLILCVNDEYMTLLLILKPWHDLNW